MEPNMRQFKMISLWVVAVVALLGVASCNSGNHNGEEVYDLSEYQRFKRFDIFSLKGVFPVISEVDTPFVYVKQAGDSILIRKSKHPEKLTVVRNRGKFWTLRSKPTEDWEPEENEDEVYDCVMHWAILPDTVMWISYFSVYDDNVSTIGAFTNNFRISKEVPLSRKAYSVAEIDSFIAEMRRSIPIFLQKHEGESYYDYEDGLDVINYAKPPYSCRIYAAFGALIDIFHIPTALPPSSIDASCEEDFFCVTHNSYVTCPADWDYRKGIDKVGSNSSYWFPME
jgi:hypothetical protein